MVCRFDYTGAGGICARTVALRQSSGEYGCHAPARPVAGALAGLRRAADLHRRRRRGHPASRWTAYARTKPAFARPFWSRLERARPDPLANLPFRHLRARFSAFAGSLGRRGANGAPGQPGARETRRRWKPIRGRWTPEEREPFQALQSEIEAYWRVLDQHRRLDARRAQPPARFLFLRRAGAAPHRHAADRRPHRHGQRARAEPRRRAAGGIFRQPAPHA